MANRIVIIGGVAGGASAAAKARRTDEQAEITIFEKGPYISFANCGLPYYVGGDIEDRDDLLLQTPESFYARFRVKVHVGHKVTAIDRAAKTVTVRKPDGSSFAEPYDKLIISPGAKAIVPSLPGVDAKNVFTLKTVPDADGLKKYVSENKPGTAVVVGAGFIGLEIAEAFAKLGLDTTIVELQKQVLPPLDAEMAAYVSAHLSTAGINMILGDGVKALHGGGTVTELELNSGLKIPAGVVVLAIGVSPETALAKSAGLEMGPLGGIKTNSLMQTSDPDIYAAGDAVECLHLVTGKPARIWLAGPANKQGRAAGANAAGSRIEFKGALATAIVRAAGIDAGKTGLSEREAQKEKMDYVAVHVHARDHASYYPGSEMLTIKLIAEKPSGRLLGAQVVGKRGVDKRIDVFATAIYAGLTAKDLCSLDLAYAPQFASAKDPAIVAGMVLENVLDGTSDGFPANRAEELKAKNPDIQFIDVRTVAEFKDGGIPGSKLIPVDSLRERMGEIDKAKEVAVYCRIGLRGYVAERMLKMNGFKVTNLLGGILLAKPPKQAAPDRRGGTGSATADAVKEALAAGTTVIDVRETDEFAYEHIAGTLNIPASQIESGAAGLQKHKPVYVLCQSGVRSEPAAETLRAKGFADVRVVEGGISSWKGKGFETVRAKGPLPIMRQVQITAGAIVLLSVLAGGGIVWLAAFVGAGLMFAGISGWCGLAKVLAVMPWNTSTPEKKGNGGDGGCGTGCGI